MAETLPFDKKCRHNTRVIFPSSQTKRSSAALSPSKTPDDTAALSRNFLSDSDALGSQVYRPCLTSLVVLGLGDGIRGAAARVNTEGFVTDG